MTIILEAQGKRDIQHEGDNAEFAEYFSDLLGAVDSFADWNDPRQSLHSGKCEHLRRSRMSQHT